MIVGYVVKVIVGYVVNTKENRTEVPVVMANLFNIIKYLLCSKFH